LPAEPNGKVVVLGDVLCRNEREEDVSSCFDASNTKTSARVEKDSPNRYDKI